MSRRTSRNVHRARCTFRLRAGLVMLAVVVSVFAGRLLQLQGVDANAYAEMAQRDSTETVTLPADRGVITDRRGVALASTVDGLMLTADPTMTRDQAPQIASVLAGRLGLDYFDLVDKLRKPDSRFVYLARRVPAAKADRVLSVLERRDLTGVFTRPDPLRVYPAGDVAANMLGFLGDNGHGLGGLESADDRLLSGHDGSATYEFAPDGRRIPLTDSTITEPRQGTGLRLTIDRDVQWMVQRRLRQAAQASRADSASAVVIDVRTGQILALADYPSFNSNHPLAASGTDRGSRSVQDIYEPGSVEKVLTASALVDAGYVTPRTKITVPPTVERDGHVIHDDVAHGRWRLTMAGVIAKSSNIGAVLASQQMPSAQLYRYLRSFGLGEPTRIGLPGESAGLLPKPADWSALTHATIAFGQGLSVNAVQMAAAIATIANGGVRIAPTLVSGYIEPDGHVRPAPAPERHRVISARAAKQVTTMMDAVTGPQGTAPNVRVPGYVIAGKTGTAERADSSCGCYRGFTVSFAGFAPADQPRFAVYVVVQNNKDGGFGSTTAGPVFTDVMRYLLQKYDVPPTGAHRPKVPVTW